MKQEKSQMFMELLKMVQNQKLSADQFVQIAAIIDFEETTVTPEKVEKQSRNKTVQRYYSNEDHLLIIKTVYHHGKNYKAAASALGLPPISVKGHMKYAGMAPCTTQADVERVKTWRKKRGLYQNLPDPIVETTPAYFGGLL
jgi:hypothetical protein